MPVRRKSGAGCLVQALGALALGVVVITGVKATLKTLTAPISTARRRIFI